MLAILFTLMGCSTTSKHLPLTEEEKPDLDLAECRKQFGAAALVTISGNEYQCRVEIDDQGKLQELYGKWKLDLVKAKADKLGDAKIKVINKDWERAARIHTEKTCPHKMTGSVIPVQNKIICTSTPTVRGIVHISP
jgi:hypothetical protein